MQTDLERYSPLYAHLPIPYYLLDAEGTIASVNAAGAQSIGYSVEQLINASITTIVHPSHRQAFQRALHELPRSPNEPQSWSFQQLHQTGNAEWVKGTAWWISSSAIALVCERCLAQPQAQPETGQARQLIHQFMQQVRQSLPLSKILDAVVHEVRQFLHADRVVIARFKADWSSQIVYESHGQSQNSMLGEVIQPLAGLFTDLADYRRGQTRAIGDIETTTISTDAQELYSRYHIRAELAVPIFHQERFWGVLVVHSCQQPRQWQLPEIEFLQELATQMEIAVQQSDLHRQVQRLNSDLEREVRQRTAQLQLAFECEAALKRITDRVRDSLDEKQIIQTALRELTLGLGMRCCNAAMFDFSEGTSTICYEHTVVGSSSAGRVSHIADFPEIYSQLLGGQYFQFCSLVPNPVRGRTAMLACPIEDDRGILGSLWLVNQSYYSFSDQDIRLVQQVANQCAIAIRQARLYEAAQAQVKELERLNRLKDDFLSTVSHELRTPVTSMKMALQMLGVSLNQELSLFSELSKPTSKQSRIARYFQILHHECDREIQLIDDLLNLQQLDAQEKVAVREAINLQMWLPRILEPFREQASQHSCTLQVDIAPNLPTLVSDSGSLKRIIKELLNNACKYTPQGEKISVYAIATGDVFRFQIDNSGIEIPAHELPYIFEKFYRVPNADPWKQGGTGLGLALVQRLITHLGGTVRVESRSAVTSFQVEIPNVAVSNGFRNVAS